MMILMMTMIMVVKRKQSKHAEGQDRKKDKSKEEAEGQPERPAHSLPHHHHHHRHHHYLLLFLVLFFFFSSSYPAEERFLRPHVEVYLELAGGRVDAVVQVLVSPEEPRALARQVVWRVQVRRRELGRALGLVQEVP